MLTVLLYRRALSFCCETENLSCVGSSFHRDKAKVVRLHTEVKDHCLPSEVGE